jgi:tubulin monoglycylase TTLL3/8
MKILSNPIQSNKFKLNPLNTKTFQNVIKTEPNNSNQNSISNNEKNYQKVKSLLEKLSKKLPQYKLNGNKNIWVLKPSTLSRGRGIQCVNNLKSVFDCLNQENINGLVIQKYIENPLLIYGKKFDIRQWVLITSLRPLTIWLWDDPYLRFSAEEYNIDNYSNIYSHLTNNCIAKYSKKYNSNNKIEGDMWDVPQFKNYLVETLKKDIWPKIKEQVLNIVLCSFDTVKNEIKFRENSFELFGFDIMFDDEWNAYLIEVNASPSMDYSTKITSKLVPEMIDNLMEIVIDRKMNDKKVGKWIKVWNGKGKIDKNNIPNKSNLY